MISIRQELDSILSGVHLNPVEHLGDRNIHFDLSPPISFADFTGQNNELSLCRCHAAENMSDPFAV